MDKVEEAKELLRLLGMPKAQQADICCYVLLAMAGIKTDTVWSNAGNEWIRIHDIIQFVNTYYETTYAENSRETFRKQALHHFRNAALVEDNGKATNSPNYRYRLTEETLQMIRTFQSSDWQKTLSRFLKYHERLMDIYASKKKMAMLPVRINGVDFQFSVGKHNELQKAIIEEFAPRFAPNSECLYVGDTIQKDLVKDIGKLTELGVEITLHDKMPDVVLYRQDNDWIYFVESVTSVGPMDSKRILELTEMTKNVTAGKIFVTAFLDFRTYKRFSETLAWETEVWIAEMPEHMIHLDGDKFLEPRKKDNLKLEEINMSEEKMSILPDIITPLSDAVQNNIPETAKQTDGALSTVVGFFNNVVLYPVKKANLTFRYKLEAFEDDLKEKIKNVPDENIQVPPTMIAGPVLEALRYTYDEDELREMYENLLASSMDNRIAIQAHPAFVDAIKQMCPLDAIVFNKIIELGRIRCAEITFRIKNTTKVYVKGMPTYFVMELVDLGDPFLISSILVNIERLGLIKITESGFEGIDYDDMKKHPYVVERVGLFSQFQREFDVNMNEHSILVTNYGEQFAAICMKKVL